jgi:hypothetical protein
MVEGKHNCGKLEANAWQPYSKGVAKLQQMCNELAAMMWQNCNRLAGNLQQ